MKIKYQIVVQWDTESICDFDALVQIEEILCEKLTRAHEVDGHDMGSGEANIFILTPSPLAAFEEIREALKGQSHWQSARVAYRKISEDVYTVLWEKELNSFNVK